MLNLNAEKKYIEEIDNKVRSLELEKVRLEQHKLYTEKAIADSVAKMKELGYTPETINSGIEEIENNISILKSKINSILGIETKEVDEDDSYPF